MFTHHATSNKSRARRGTLVTPHGAVDTPCFMPIATRGAVKTISSDDLKELGASIILSNTYHLYLRPGLDVLKSAGGLHPFMSWLCPLLTDSGGYQVFSLAKMSKITEEGALFASHIDGSRHLLTPELSIQIQQIIGSDIIMVLDECTPANSTSEYLRDSVSRTTRWAERSKKEFEKGREASFNQGAQLFGIVQGGTDEEMRKRHAADLVSIGFDGYAIGGLSVGEEFDDSCRIVEAVDGVLPEDKPRYFMGGAKPEEIVAYVRRGIDMFDCVLPTRNARHGQLYRFVHDDLTRPDFYEIVHITNEKCKKDFIAVAAEFPDVSHAYLRHLFTVEETLGCRIATLINLKFYLDLMARVREGIETGGI